ncbi:rhamnan synthesis F family protein [Pseudobutyrivibrio sp. MD2005]|uniref:rhamnan synthesis F family protein n=1 Tax=Pseudobutyrivibrio sp. MD2005 TaxID=1410616 RepID=UPI000489A70F|nr:rhamnan synthesis F family protein [Pseudobutyrivibrio sp. MD2005]
MRDNDINKIDKRYYVLPKGYSKQQELNRVGIIIYLYYEESIDFYVKYINRIMGSIRIMVISSKKEIIDYFNQHRGNLKNVTCIYRMENRGRDIAALLIEGRDFFLENDYIAFLHDKTPKYQHTSEDTFLWNKSMWDNTLISKDYINNIISLFEGKKELGLALPVLDIGNCFILTYKSASEGWSKNYSNALKICKELNIKCKISDTTAPISYGTIFWCRTEALKKLYSRKWELVDFPEEPLPNDGTISHAIERILPYISEDAGYKTCMIMNDSFATSYLSIIDIMMKKMWNMMNVDKGIIYPYQLLNEDFSKSRLKKFCSEYERILIYGAGRVGISCYKYMTEILEENPSAFIDAKKTGQILCNIPVISIDEVTSSDNVGIIIAVGPHFIDEIINILVNKGMSNFISYYLVI